ncbi:MAG: hypothetical protein RI894_1219 [Bacteroidota bacterium]|jgi:hypothetical protein
MAKKLNPTTSQTEVVQQREAARPSFEVASSEMLFGRENYRLMLIGIGLVVLGFILMIGGNMPDQNTWDESLIYSFTHITLSPIVILVGLGIEVYAIFFSGKEDAMEMAAITVE